MASGHSATFLGAAPENLIVSPIATAGRAMDELVVTHLLKPLQGKACTQ
jgi:hypothetical protein